ncbi:transposase [Niabella ginsengisoli]|uniref:Transposase n=1 Tax=Niabella ginsengisoli TaxID=522298 RepID=A0ABS9SEP0_9BACT|nr:transposase [Niabella ginsengisoli]MCH5596831.1 transposase [Niabella ginsengisoli]
MNNPSLQPKRKSFLEHNEVYFWTATIHQWNPLMLADKYKDVVIDSLRYLSVAGKIDVYAFVIMPNHIHLIWRINEPNGKESPQGSLLKYTAHQFKKMLRSENNHALSLYAVNASNKSYEFWQRDSLATPLYTHKVALQKLKYIHNNPLAEYWQLAKDPCDYKYSSAPYYELDKKNFNFLKDL